MRLLIFFYALTILLSGCVNHGHAGHRRVPPSTPTPQRDYPQQAPQSHRNYSNSPIDVLVINDRGQQFPLYPHSNSAALRKDYLQAFKGNYYSIEVSNRTNQRIGVVVAVDGRNIISGQRSKLRSKEQMYILEPREHQSFSGWRSGKNRVNRFYFSAEDNSYSASFGDYSAMGVIAVAAYNEYQRYPRNRNRERYSSPSESSRRKSLQDEAGTGWGEREYSPSSKARFKPEKQAFATHLIKYEWEESLCRKNIINCRQRSRRNRMWNNNERYATPPGPNFRRYDE